MRYSPRRHEPSRCVRNTIAAVCDGNHITVRGFASVIAALNLVNDHIAAQICIFQLLRAAAAHTMQATTRAHPVGQVLPSSRRTPSSVTHHRTHGMPRLFRAIAAHTMQASTPYARFGKCIAVVANIGAIYDTVTTTRRLTQSVRTHGTFTILGPRALRPSGAR